MASPDTAGCVTLTKESGEKIERARSLAGLQAKNAREGLKKDYFISVYFF